MPNTARGQKRAAKRKRETRPSSRIGFDAWVASLDPPVAKSPLRIGNHVQVRVAETSSAPYVGVVEWISDHEIVIRTDNRSVSINRPRVLDVRDTARLR